MTSNDAPAARHTLRILSLLAAQRGPIAASTIAASLGLPRSTVYRLLSVLEEHGFVLHFPDARRFGIGIAAFEMSSGYSRQEPLSRLGRPILAGLVDRIGESVHLAVLHGKDVIYLVEERAPGRQALVTDVGVRLPSYLTASGRALLATLPKSQVRALFPRAEAFVDRATAESARHPLIASYSQLTRVLNTVRADGFAVEDGDVTEGLSSVAVAVLDHSGWPSASIAATFATGSVDSAGLIRLRTEVGGAAEELSHRIRGRQVDSAICQTQ